MNLLQQIQAHRQNKIVTIPFSHAKLTKYIFMARKMYHLIGGAGGTGKSAWIDYNYILQPYFWYKTNTDTNIKLNIVLRSLERSKEHRKAKWVCMLLFLRHGILIDTKNLLGWGVKKSKISDELYELIKQKYDQIEAMEDVVTIIDGVENPTGIYMHAVQHYEKMGTLYFYKKVDDVLTLLKRRDGKLSKAHVQETIDSETGKAQVSQYEPYFKPDNPNEIGFYILDNMQALKKEKSFSGKENIDKMSEYLRIFRDLYGGTPVVVSQLNRGMTDTMRKTKTDLLPDRSDFAGSDQMYSDADMAGILFNPWDYNIRDMKGWNIANCVNEHGINRFRSFHLLKNSYGPDNNIFAYQFVGEIGAFNELPSPDKITANDYEIIKNPPRTQNLTSY